MTRSERPPSLRVFLAPAQWDHSGGGGGGDGRKACSPGTSGSPFSPAWRLPRSRSSLGTDGGGGQSTTLPRPRPRRNSHVPRSVCPQPICLSPQDPSQGHLRKGVGVRAQTGDGRRGRTLLEPLPRARPRGPVELFQRHTEREGLSSSRGHGLSLEWGPRARATPLSPIIREAEGKWGRKVLRTISVLCLRRPHPPHLPPGGSEGAEEQVGPSGRMYLQAPAAQTPAGRPRVGRGTLRV